MIQIIWHYGEPPKAMQVRQVYAIAFDAYGRVLIKKDEVEKGKFVYGMFGGTPEDYDQDRIATLKREFLEEANTTLKDNIYLAGYQEIVGDQDRAPYAQLRMVAQIDTIGEKLPDPDNGKTYDRVLTTPQRAIELLGWGDSGEKQVLEALRIANEKFVFEKRIEEEQIL